MQTQTIDLTPTWKEILPALIMLVKDGETKEAQETGWRELWKMACAADDFNKMVGKA